MDLPERGQPLVSVVVPAFNAEKHISTCLESLRRQTLAGFEIVVIDDGSIDETAVVADNILSRSSLPYQVLSQPNQGVSAARNHGLDVARGKYVMFLDSDDYIGPDCLSKLALSAESTGSDIVFCGCDFVSENGEVLRAYSSRHTYLEQTVAGPEALCRVFIEKLGVWPGSMIFNKDFLETHGLSFKEGRVIAEDLEFEFKALFHARRVSSVNESLFFYVQRAGSVTGTVDMLKRFQGMDVLFSLKDYFTDCISKHSPGTVCAGRSRCCPGLPHDRMLGDTSRAVRADSLCKGDKPRGGLRSEDSVGSQAILERKAVYYLKTYMIPVSLAGVFGALAAAGYPRVRLKEILKNRPDFRQALSEFSPAEEANLASRRRFQVQLLRYFPSAYFMVSRIFGGLRT